jgi:hypothetical protein
VPLLTTTMAAKKMPPRLDEMSFTDAVEDSMARRQPMPQEPARADEDMPMENYAEPAEKKQPTRAEVVSPDEDAQLMSVYKIAMGSDFDPNSKSDARKLDELRSFMASKPDLQGMSANKIALAFYRRK